MDGEERAKTGISPQGPNNKKQWSISTRLNVLLSMVVLSGIFGLVGAVEINKSVTLTKLNFFHIKYERRLSDHIANLKIGAIDINAIRNEVILIRQQPLDCLDLVNGAEVILFNLGAGLDKMFVFPFFEHGELLGR